MRKVINTGAFVITVALIYSGTAFGQSGTCSGMSLGQGANLNGFVPFPSSSLWNTDISAAPVDPNSANIINFIGATVTLHPDFGAGTFRNQTIGIPYQTVAGSQAKVPVTLGAFFDESDPGPEPAARARVVRSLARAAGSYSSGSPHFPAAPTNPAR